MFKENKTTIIILILLFLGIGFLVYYFGMRDLNNKNKIKETEYNELVYIKDESLFFSISNNINKICEYVDNNKALSLYNLLDDEYVRNNIIDGSNVLNYFSDYKNTTFRAIEISAISNRNKYIFIVQGQLLNNMYDAKAFIKDNKSFIVYYDIDTNVFKVNPISYDEYLDYLKRDRFDFKDIVENSDNRFNMSSYDNDTLAMIYFNFIKNNFNDNASYIYDNIDSDTKNIYFNTLEKFVDFVIENNYFNNNYLVKYYKSDNVYTLVDNKNYKYIFEIDHGLKFLLKIDLEEAS